MLTWFRSFLGLKRKEKREKTIPIFKIETPEKIVETKIQPVKVPTIVDIGERLGRIWSDISFLKQEMVTKTWFKEEYEDTGDVVLEKLEIISTKLDTLLKSFSSLEGKLKKLLNFLSNFTKPSFSPKRVVNIREEIYDVIKNNEKIRYKEIANAVLVSDPTLSKYLKELVLSGRIKKTRVGKAVYYEVVQ